MSYSRGLPRPFPLGDACEDCQVPASVAHIDCSSFPYADAYKLMGAQSFNSVLSILNVYAPSIYDKVMAIIQPRAKPCEDPCFRTLVKGAHDSSAADVSIVEVAASMCPAGLVPHFNRELLIQLLKAKPGVSLRVNGTRKELAFDGHVFPLDLNEIPSHCVAEEILEAWGIFTGQKHALFPLTAEEEEFLPLLRKLVAYTRTGVKGRFTVSPVHAFATPSASKLAVKELEILRAHLLSGLYGRTVRPEFAYDSDSVLIHVLRTTQVDWSLLGFKECPVHIAALREVECAGVATAAVECALLSAEPTSDLPQLVDDDANTAEESVTPKFSTIIKRDEADANAPFVVRVKTASLAGECVYGLLCAEMVSVTLSVGQIQAQLRDKQYHLSGRLLRKVLRTDGRFVKTTDGWRVRAGFLPRPFRVNPKSCSECVTRRDPIPWYEYDLDVTRKILSIGQVARDETLSHLATHLDPPYKVEPHPSYGFGGEIVHVRDPLHCDAVVAEVLAEHYTSHHMLGVAVLWATPDPCAVGKVVPRPQMCAVGSQKRIFLYDLKEFGYQFPDSLAALLTNPTLRKVTSCHSETLLLCELLDLALPRVVTLGEGANYAAGEDIRRSLACSILNTGLPPLPQKCAWGRKDLAAHRVLAAHAAITWRLAYEVLYQRVRDGSGVPLAPGHYFHKEVMLNDRSSVIVGVDRSLLSLPADHEETPHPIHRRNYARARGFNWSLGPLLAAEVPRA